jgi:putative ABC transport system permease protein
VGWRMVGFAFAAALLSALIFSIAPAIEHSRPDLAFALKGEAPLRRMRQRDIYVVAQVALSLVLLIAATLLLRGLQHAREVEPGFAMDHRLAARINVSEPEYTPETGRIFLDRVLERIRAVPGVRSATISYTTPLNMSSSVCAMPDPATRPRRVSSDTIGAGYFDTLSIPIVRGRDFSPQDQASSPSVVIVNETYARRNWPNADPIGKSVWVGCDAGRARNLAQVVGVAKDAKYESLDEAPRSYVYRPLAQHWEGFVAVIVHTSGNPNDFSTPLRTMLHGMDPNLRVYDIETLEDFATESLWRVRWQAALLAVFGGLGMLLAAVGLYGVVAYAVAQRTREIGVRLAIGAQKADVLWMVLGRGLGLTAIGIASGLLLSAGVTRMMGGLVYGLSPLDPASFAAASLVWTLTAMLASYVPARRAKVDPVVALRWE